MCEFPDILHGTGCLCLGNGIVSSFPVSGLVPPGADPLRVLQTAVMDGLSLLRKETNPDALIGNLRLDALPSLGSPEAVWDPSACLEHVHIWEHLGLADVAQNPQEQLRVSRVLSGSGYSSPMKEFCSLNKDAATSSSSGHPKGQNSPKIPAWSLQEHLWLMLLLQPDSP